MMRRSRTHRRPAAVGAALIAVTLMTACSGGSTRRASVQSTQSDARTGRPAYTNPVYADDFPDPALLRVGNVFVAYGTQAAGHAVQTLTSRDLVHWTPGPERIADSAELGDRWQHLGARGAAHPGWLRHVLRGP
jgi:hypothetical protein